MVKLKNILFIAFALILVLLPCVSAKLYSNSLVPSKAAAAATEDIDLISSRYSSLAKDYLNEYKNFKSRVAGSEGEKQAADYLLSKLNSNSNISPKKNAFISDGKQKFSFESVLTGKFENSQNIIFDYIGDSSSKNKIIIGTNYDAVAYKSDGQLHTAQNIIECESIAGSAASVAALLALTDVLPDMGLKFNIEFVFFGAGESNNAGAEFYVSGISNEDKENIALMINFDNMAVGSEVYFYSEEVQDSFSNKLNEIALNIDGISRVNTMHLGKTLLNDVNEIGLDYVHVALVSANYSFMKKGMKALNIFAGDYDNGIVLGRNEFDGKEIVRYTENDNLEYIEKNYGGVIEKNYNSTFKLLSTELLSSTFLQDLSEAKNQTNWFYSMFGNEKLVIFLTVLVFVMLVIIAMFIHYKLTIKAYHANIEIEFLHSVVKICENVGGEENFDDETPTEVSKILAEDIKRDKTIKASKKEKDKEK